MEITLYEAKANLSKIIQSLIDKKEEEIIISKNGKPIVQMTLIHKKNSKRIGVIDKKNSLSITQEEFDSIEIGDFDL